MPGKASISCSCVSFNKNTLDSQGLDFMELPGEDLEQHLVFFCNSSSYELSTNGFPEESSLVMEVAWNSH
ncbi:hypothetical protein CKAN_02412300 [Cinnamomum micranthum f. kanehirae]|uniref:Uncharacterized protein n=1 Tax=Cinnamomum micranthum f. kanehirae TaxID=337451 RepID=A0A3S3N951_9MAGN|nr:hypothetical protein CKAN_02412300 [Cinnamomum micranthum f. kanehirae]